MARHQRRFLRACGLRSLHAPLRSFALVAGFAFRCVGMPAFSQAAYVFGAANAGALKAITRAKASMAMSLAWGKVPAQAVLSSGDGSAEQS